MFPCISHFQVKAHWFHVVSASARLMRGYRPGLRRLGSSGIRDEGILIQTPGGPSVAVNTPMRSMIQTATRAAKVSVLLTYGVHLEYDLKYNIIERNLAGNTAI